MPTAKRSLRHLAMLVALAITLSITSLAQAGGWFVITLDSWPASAVAGQPLSIGFVLRQHGRTPAYWDGLSLVAHNPATGKAMRVTPRTEGQVGHYAADITFPESGSWEWGIDFERRPWVRWAPLAVLAAPVVAIAKPVASPAPSPAATLWLPFALALAATILFLAALYVGRSRRAVGVILGLGAAAGAIALAMVLLSSPEAVVVASAVPAPSAADPVSEGRALFLAKGCVTCHVHAEAPSNGFTSVSIGPVLTDYTAAADSTFLRQWLANPASLRPAAEMPTLGLTGQEIESLVAFLSN